MDDFLSAWQVIGLYCAEYEGRHRPPGTGELPCIASHYISILNAWRLAR
jgi:hypothetical protein